MTGEEFTRKYAELAHGIQTGIRIKFAHEYDFDQNLINALKHLRVGIDTQKSDLGAVGRLLIKKGVFTEQEYFEAVLEGLKDELKSYEAEVQIIFGGNKGVSLG